MADGPRGRFLLDGFRKPGAPLAVTISEKGKGYKITHIGSGCALWPNTWTKAQAIGLCEGLLSIDGWDREFEIVINDELLRAKAERMVLNATRNQ